MAVWLSFILALLVISSYLMGHDLLRLANAGNKRGEIRSLLLNQTNPDGPDKAVQRFDE